MEYKEYTGPKLAFNKPHERKRIYELCKELVTDADCGYRFICKVILDVTIIDYYWEVLPNFPELSSMKPEHIPEHMGWFSENHEGYLKRLAILDECIRLCDKQIKKSEV